MHLVDLPNHQASGTPTSVGLEEINSAFNNDNVSLESAYNQLHQPLKHSLTSLQKI